MAERFTRSIGTRVLLTAGSITLVVFAALGHTSRKDGQHSVEAARAGHTGNVTQATGETALTIAEDLNRLVAAFQL